MMPLFRNLQGSGSPDESDSPAFHMGQGTKHLNAGTPAKPLRVCGQPYLLNRGYRCRSSLRRLAHMPSAHASQTSSSEGSMNSGCLAKP